MSSNELLHVVDNRCFDGESGKIAVEFGKQLRRARIALPRLLREHFEDDCIQVAAHLAGVACRLITTSYSNRARQLRLVFADRTRLLVRLVARTGKKSTRLNSSHLGISYAVFCL